LALLLDKGETPLVCWRCLMSHETKAVRTRDELLRIAMAPLTQMYLNNDTLAGYIVVTNHKLAFVESGLLPSRYAWGGAIPLEQITGISTNGELVIDADCMGWKWCLRKLMIEGFPSVSASIATVAGFLRDAVKSRKLEIDQEKRDRRRRIGSFYIRSERK